LPYHGKKGEVCPVCNTNKIQTQFALTCGTVCGDALRLSKREPTKTPSTESLDVKGDSATVTKTIHERVKTLADLKRVCGVDEAEWEVERWVCEKYDNVSVPRATGKSKEWSRPDARPQITEMFLVKAWLKRKVALVAARDELKEMLSEAKKHAAKYAAIKQGSESRASGNMLEINIADHHFGKLAWGQETGHSDYDVKIAEALWDDAVEALVQRTSSISYERVVLIVGNDLLHADNKQGTTTKGTQVTTDSRYPKTFTLVRRAIVRTVERLRLIAPVDVVIVPGNHDELSSFCLGDALECWFAKCPGVTVNNSPTMRKYMEWGSVMLMWTHGNAGKLENYPILMASEQRQMWGRTIWREAHTGDKHQRKLIELHGVAVRILPTLCAADDWHSKMQFVGNMRCAEAYIWNKDEGLVGTAVYAVSPQNDQEAA
jgi:hypothetical protein